MENRKVAPDPGATIAAMLKVVDRPFAYGKLECSSRYRSSRGQHSTLCDVDVRGLVPLHSILNDCAQSFAASWSIPELISMCLVHQAGSPIGWAGGHWVEVLQLVNHGPVGRSRHEPIVDLFGSISG